MNKKKAVNRSCYPDEVIERLARCFYPAILESFSNEEDQKAFAAWQTEQARCSAKEKQDVPAGERPAIHRQLFSSRVRPSGAHPFYDAQSLLLLWMRNNCGIFQKGESVSFELWIQPQKHPSAFPGGKDSDA